MSAPDFEALRNEATDGVMSLLSYDRSVLRRQAQTLAGSRGPSIKFLTADEERAAAMRSSARSFNGRWNAASAR